MVGQAERYADDRSKDRLRAIEYYNGEMNDTKADDGRSQMVSRDVRAHIKKVLPSLSRVFLNSDEIVEYLPVGEGDEEQAEQASDYINCVVAPESDARTAICDAIHDALLLRNGIIRWWHDERKAVKFSKHTGLTIEALGELIEPDDVEVLSADRYEEEVEGQMVEFYDVSLRREFMDKNIRAAAVPRERFLIHPDAVTLEDSLLVGEKTSVTRSDLISMGYDRKTIDGLTMADEDDTESDARRDDVSESGEAQHANEPIDYYDLFIRVDMDDDGISELRHMTFAGGLKERNMLTDDEVDEVQYCDIRVMSQPHQWEGISLADDLMELQRGKTVLLRQTLDNIYWQNNPQPTMQSGSVLNPDAVYNPEFGLPIEVAKGVDVRAALGFTQVPFVAKDSFSMMSYLDEEAQDRTGVSDASAGLAPDALQNMTAKASSMIEAQGIGQTELMVRTVAEGVRKLFRGLLRMSVRHQDVPRTVRLRKEWVHVDPRHWNADMDCAVNTGLGAGTRERDVQMMQAVLTLQEKLLTTMGADNPFVKPENLYNTLAKLVESAGLKTASMYFTEPDPEEIAARLKQQAEAPNPEQMKIEAQMQLEQAKMQTNTAKEQAQMQADLQVKQAEIEADKQKQADKLASDAALQREQHNFEWRKFTAQLEADRAAAAQSRQDEIHKVQAAAFNTAAE